MSVTDALLGPLLALDSGRPLITYYDDADGTRVELSRATMANWAAKTANWLVEETDAEAGTPVSVRLPAHWQTLGVLLGAWWCGAHVTDGPAEVTFVSPAEHPNGPAGAEVTAVVALDPMGMGLPAEPGGGAVDYLTEIRSYGDTFAPLFPIPGDTPALFGSTVDELIAAARRDSDRYQGVRVLSTLDWSAPGAIQQVLAVLAGGGQLVQCEHSGEAALAAHASTERTTVTLP